MMDFRLFSGTKLRTNLDTIFLLYVQTMEFTEAQYLRERFIPLFLSAGASFDEPTIVGSAGEILTAH